MITLRKPVRSKQVESLWNSIVKHDKAILRELRVVHEPLGVHLLDGLHVHAGARVCDVGCGLGGVVRRAADLVGPRGVATGIDLSGLMIEACRRAHPAGDYRHHDIVPTHVLHETDAFVDDADVALDEHLHPTDDLWGQYDYVLSLETFSYFEDYEYAARQHTRLLRAGGTFVWGGTFFSENPRARDAQHEALGHVKAGRVATMSLRPAHYFLELFAAAGLTHRGTQVFEIGHGMLYLVLRFDLLPHRPIPSPSETLSMAFPTPLPRATVFRADAA